MRSSTPSSRRTRTGRARDGGPGGGGRRVPLPGPGARAQRHSAGGTRRMTRQLAVNMGACALRLRHGARRDRARRYRARLAARRFGGQSGFDCRRPRDHRSGVQRGQLRQLRARLQLDDHGGAMGTGASLLPRRGDTRIPSAEHRSSEAAISAVLLDWAITYREEAGTLQTRLSRIIITAGVGAVALGAGLGGSLAVASAATSHAASASSTTARTSSADSGNVAAATPAPSATHSTHNCPNMNGRPATG